MCMPFKFYFVVLDNNANLSNLFEYSFCHSSKVGLFPKLLMKNTEEGKGWKHH